jgi:Amt family ammonium transporter
MWISTGTRGRDDQFSGNCLKLEHMPPIQLCKKRAEPGSGITGMALFRRIRPLVLGMAGAGVASAAWAQGSVPAGAAGANTAWVLTASALVLFMTLPGLALFYGGLVRARSVLSILMHCVVITCVVSLIWAAFGYGLAFGEGGALLGPVGKLFLTGLTRAQATGIPENVFALFQMTFAIITPALIIGAFPERASFPFVLLFSALWLIVVYLPVAHWLWGGGWLAAMGVVDFAGGIVVHTTAGTAALVAAVMVGRRHGFPTTLVPPHSPVLTMAGAGMLWVGWFGFNGGSALAADAGAGSAILATHLAASAAALTWMAIEWLKIGKPTSIGVVTGCVAGLATITPGSGFVGPGGAIAIGVLGAAACFYAVLLVKQRLRIDDSLDVFAVHGVGGMIGSVLVGIFATPLLGGVTLPSGAGMAGQVGLQALAVAVTAAWSIVATAAIIKLIGSVVRLRVSTEEEIEGLDIVAHGERAYDFN